MNLSNRGNALCLGYCMKCCCREGLRGVFLRSQALGHMVQGDQALGSQVLRFLGCMVQGDQALGSQVLGFLGCMVLGDQALGSQVLGG